MPAEVHAVLMIDGEAVSAANPLPSSAVIEAGDIQIGAVEIKNATDDTRATVGASGLYVDVRAVLPGTGATSLGKAIDSAVGATDTGVALLAKHVEDQLHLTTADGDYDALTVDSLGSLHVNAEAHHVFDSFNATTGWTVLGDDTANLATTAKHLTGTAALTFDKVDGAGNTVFAGIQKTLTATDLGAVSLHDLLQGAFYLPSLTNVAYVFLRLGTDSTNYNEWRIPVDQLTAATFVTGSLTVGDADHGGITGSGWNPAVITYIAVGVAFDAAANTLAGIIFDEVSYHTNQHTSAVIGSEVTSVVSSANINLQKLNGTVIDRSSGVVSNGTQRVVLATDVALPAGTNSIGAVTARDSYDVAVSFTRTADTAAYLANDVIGSTTSGTSALTFANIGPSGGAITITGAELEIDDDTLISGMTSFRLYLYSATPGSILDDNDPFDLPSGDRASFLGYIDLGTIVDLGSTLYVQSTFVGKDVRLATASLFGYLVTVGAFTPESETGFKVTLHATAR